MDGETVRNVRERGIYPRAKPKVKWRINFGCRSKGDWGLHKVLKKLAVQRNLNQ